MFCFWHVTIWWQLNIILCCVFQASLLADVGFQHVGWQVLSRTVYAVCWSDCYFLCLTLTTQSLKACLDHHRMISHRWHGCILQTVTLPSRAFYFFFFFFWYSVVVAGQWLPSLIHITDICLLLVSLLFHIPHICCSSAVVSFSFSYVFQSCCLLERLA